MKKLLSILASVGLTATTATSVVACGPTEQKTTTHKANVPESALEINLTETHKGDKTLAQADQTFVKKTALDKLKELNDDAVINDDTFTIVDLDKVAPSDGAIKINVKATEAKDDKKGLEEETIDFKVKLLTANYGQKDVKSISKQTIPLGEADIEENKLTDAGQTKVKTTITNELKKENTDVVIEKDTFTIQLDETTTSDTEVKVKVKETQGTQEKYGLKAKDLTIKIQLKTEKDSVLEKVQKLVKDGLVISKDIEEIKEADVTAQLTEELKEFGDKVTLEQTDFSPITIEESGEESGIKKGETIFIIKYQGVAITDPETEKNEFTIPFITEELKEPQDILNHLQEGAQVKLSRFDLGDALGLGKSRLGDILDLAGSLIIDNNLIPDQIPTNFEDDANWIQWTTALEKLQGLILDATGFDINESIRLGHDEDKDPQEPIVIKIPEMGLDLYVRIDTKISDILSAILPDLIHFRQFLFQQRDEKQNENLLLLFIQYLFTEPKDINGDGFNLINKGIKNFDPQTNLENLMYDVLLGWKTSENKEWTNGNKTEPQPLNIKLGGYFINEKEKTFLRLKYFGETLLIIPTAIGLSELLPVENIKAFINKLFDYNLNGELKLTINIPKNLRDFKPELPETAEVDLGNLILNDTIKNGLTNILNTDQYLEDRLGNWKFLWKEGTLKIEILKEGKWVYAEEFDDLMEATDIHVKFVNNLLEAKYNDWTFELQNIEITIDLDLNSSIIIG